MRKKNIFSKKSRNLKTKAIRLIFFTALFFGSMFITQKLLARTQFLAVTGNNSIVETNLTVDEENKSLLQGKAAKAGNEGGVQNIGYTENESSKQVTSEDNPPVSNESKPQDAQEKKDEQSVKVEEIYSFGREEGKKYVYLTFDDGPNNVITPKVLDILKEENISATFFVVGTEMEKSPDMLKRIKEEGHSIGSHTYSHNYKILYPNNTVDVAAFNGELDKNQKVMQNILGNDFFTRLVRFPGGSFEAWKKPMKDELQKEGKYYIDWNAENGDGVKQNVTKEEQISRLTQNINSAEANNKNIVVLMHDASAKKTSLEALPEIIKLFKAHGYEFRSIK